jgi:hypothetical protein
VGPSGQRLRARAEATQAGGGLLGQLGRLTGSQCGVGCSGRLARAAAGLLREVERAAACGCCCWAGEVNGPEQEREKGRVIKVWVFGRDSNQIEFKLLNLNSNNQKQCSSMYATFNSYVSLILFFRKVLNA